MPLIAGAIHLVWLDNNVKLKTRYMKIIGYENVGKEKVYVVTLDGLYIVLTYN